MARIWTRAVSRRWPRQSLPRSGIRPFSSKGRELTSESLGNPPTSRDARSDEGPQQPSVSFHSSSVYPWRRSRHANTSSFRRFSAENHQQQSVQDKPPSFRRSWSPERPTTSSRGDAHLEIDGKIRTLSAILLRDMCECPRCVDPSTRQKLFSTTDIPLDISVGSVLQDASTVSILWDRDIPGFDENHTTQLSLVALKRLVNRGSTAQLAIPRMKRLWNGGEIQETAVDINYDEYMGDDIVLYKALVQLHTHGLVFLTGVPESEAAVSDIAQRIGPLKSTFYGETWDVRSIPDAKNVAYTSQDLGFHMDLLYMEQPPHLQFLHCIRSSSAGGASLFVDSYKAATTMLLRHGKEFEALARVDVCFHYNHPSSHLYHQRRRVFEMKDFAVGETEAHGASSLRALVAQKLKGSPHLVISDWVDAVSWAPPFQAPFSLRQSEKSFSVSDMVEEWHAEKLLDGMAIAWHNAACRFNELIHLPGGIYERLMKPGECVLFDNRRVLHARKAFEVGDVGKERWLRGAYLDKDPYLSKLRVLEDQLTDEEKTLVTLSNNRNEAGVISEEAAQQA